MSLLGMGQVYAGLSPANCATAGGVYDGDSEECMAPSTSGSTASTAGPTSPNLANPDAGTFEDVNCPFWCWLLGNGIDTAVSAACFPCGNVCPAGTIWDTTNYVCSATPATSNTSSPAGSKNNPTPCTSSIIPNVCDSTIYISGGIIAAVLLMLVVKK